MAPEAAQISIEDGWREAIAGDVPFAGDDGLRWLYMVNIWHSNITAAWGLAEDMQTENPCMEWAIRSYIALDGTMTWEAKLWGLTDDDLEYSWSAADPSLATAISRVCCKASPMLDGGGPYVTA